MMKPLFVKLSVDDENDTIGADVDINAWLRIDGKISKGGRR